MLWHYAWVRTSTRVCCTLLKLYVIYCYFWIPATVIWDGMIFELNRLYVLLNWPKIKYSHQFNRFEPTDIDATCISYLEEQLAHQIKSTVARLSISDQEDDDRESSWTENADNGEDDEYDSDHIITDWEAVSYWICSMRSLPNFRFR